MIFSSSFTSMEQDVISSLFLYLIDDIPIQVFGKFTKIGSERLKLHNKRSKDYNGKSRPSFPGWNLDIVIFSPRNASFLIVMFLGSRVVLLLIYYRKIIDWIVLYSTHSACTEFNASVKCLFLFSVVFFKEKIKLKICINTDPQL